MRAGAQRAEEAGVGRGLGDPDIHQEATDIAERARPLESDIPVDFSQAV